MSDEKGPLFNVVEVLLRVIDEIQQACGRSDHKWGFDGALPTPQESRIEGVFLGDFTFSVRCLVCSLKGIAYPHLICPQCRGEMRFIEKTSEASRSSKYSEFPLNRAQWEDGGEELYACSVCPTKITRRIYLAWEH